VRGSPTIKFQPSGSARVRSNASVCGCVSESTKNDFCFHLRSALGQRHGFGGRSGFIEQRGVGDVEPERSQIMVWKLNSASSRPWLISG